MSKFFKGDVTNGVVEFNLLDPAVGAGGTTATVVTKNTGANDVLQIVGDIPENYASTEGITSTAKGLVIGTSCTSIGSRAFYLCPSLIGDLVIPDSVTSIGSYAFYLCSSFTGTLTIPNSVTTIGLNAFRDCSFNDVVIPNSVTSIGSYAFYYCTNLTTAYIAPPLANVGSDAFYASGLTTVYAKDAATNGWTEGAGQTVGGKTGVTVAEWNNYPNPIPN